MSFCTSATVAAKKAVAAPTATITALASGAYSSSGDMRQTRKTPAVTMVAAWISAETGVGPSIASGSQVCRNSCADLPIAPMNSKTPIRLAAFQSAHRKRILVSASTGPAAKTSSNRTESTTKNSAKMPSANPKSPTRFTIKAFIAAALALGLR